MRRAIQTTPPDLFFCMFSGFITGYDAAMLPFPEHLIKPLEHGYEQHGPKLVVAINLLLLIAVAFSVAKLLWAFVPTPEAARWHPAPAAASALPASGSASLNTVLNAHLFGLYRVSATSDIATAPETRLDLKLIGILAGSRTGESRALIAQQGSIEKSYAIGDDIVRGVTLQAIFPDRVILARDGQMETLRLDPLSGAGSAYAPPAQVGSNDNGAASVSLSQARQEMLQDPNRAADYIRVQPNNPGGQLHGYRIYPGKNASVFTNAGLRPGDLVTSVNGTPLDDTQKALQMLNELSRAGSVSLTVDRGGQTQTINVSFN